MKPAISISRILVGALFIFSGLVKANDPLGLGYKMQEFFEVWNMGLSKGSFFLNHTLINLFNFLHEHSLALAVFMIAFELIAGAALLFGWKMKLFGWLLLLIILFFTFLTGYAFLSGKFKNCGCFGDCLPITPKTSFLKDLLLTVLILFLFRQRKKIKPLFSAKATALSMLAVILLSFGIQWYMLSYLPIVDCLPFKKGNNISDKMKMPADAIPDSTVITFVYKKDGKEIEFTADKFPPDFNATTYQFVRRSDKLIRKGKNNEPEIKGFVLTTENNDDSTEAILKDPDYKVLVFTPGFESVHPAWINRFSTFYDKLKERNIRLYIVTSDYDNANLWASKRNISKEITIFKCDFTIIKIAARTNPCFYLVKQGTIINKWSYKRISDAEKQVSKIPVQPATSNQ